MAFVVEYCCTLPLKACNATADCCTWSFNSCTGVFKGKTDSDADTNTALSTEEVTIEGAVRPPLLLHMERRRVDTHIHTYTHMRHP